MIRVPDTELDLSQDGTVTLRQGAPFTGVMYECHQDGRLRSEIEFTDGIENGMQREYFPSGSVASESCYGQGSAWRLERVWFMTGQLKSEVVYFYGLPVSKKGWDEAGVLAQSDEMDDHNSLYDRFEGARKEYRRLAGLMSRRPSLPRKYS
jgi:antitoxin component YwqK of YwqJK toxin-antitoxin module